MRFTCGRFQYSERQDASTTGKINALIILFQSTLKTAEDAKRRVINDCARMELELEGYRKESLTQLKEHEELSTLREENSRLTDKVEYLEVIERLTGYPWHFL